MCGEVRRERSHHSQSNTLVNLGLSPPITAGALILDPESGFPIPVYQDSRSITSGSRSRTESEPEKPELSHSTPVRPIRNQDSQPAAKYIHVSFELSFCLSLLLLLCCYCVVIISFPIGRHFNQSEKIIPSWRERSPGVWAANVTPQLAKGKTVMSVISTFSQKHCQSGVETITGVTSICGATLHHVLSLGSVTNLVTRWRHLYCRIAWECPSDIIN